MESAPAGSMAQTDTANTRALRVLGVVALVFSAIGLGLCVLCAFALLATLLPDRAWQIVATHDLDLWVGLVGATGPVVAGFGGILAGISLLIAWSSRSRAGGAGWALIVSALAIAIFACAWILSGVLFA